MSASPVLVAGVGPAVTNSHMQSPPHRLSSRPSHTGGSRRRLRSPSTRASRCREFIDSTRSPHKTTCGYKRRSTASAARFTIRQSGRRHGVAKAAWGSGGDGGGECDGGGEGCGEAGGWSAGQD